MDSHSQGRDPVRLGALEFKYEQPDISVDSSARTVEHELIDDDVVVQRIGRDPRTVRISAVVTEYEAKLVDNLIENTEPISLRSERWSGDVITTDTATDPLNAKDAEGSWLYDAQITCKEVQDNTQTTDTELPYSNYFFKGQADG